MKPASEPPAWHECATCGNHYRFVNANDECHGCELARQQQEERKWRTQALRELLFDRPAALAVMQVDTRIVREPYEVPNPYPKATNHRVSLREWSGDPPTVTISGEVGTGKSMFAAEMLYLEACRLLDGYVPKVSESPRKVVAQTGHWTRARRAVSALLEDRESRSFLERVPVLVIDDLGVGHPGGGWEHIAALGADRDAACLATIWTTNLSLTQIGEAEAGRSETAVPRLADRMRAGVLIRMDGRSRRGS